MLDVRDKQSITDFMIIATGTSNRQIGAMLDKVREAVKALGIKPLGEEGKGDSDWVLLDMDDVIVHMMTASARQFYDLERLWAGAAQSRAESAAHHSPENTHEHFTKLNIDLYRGATELTDHRRTVLLRLRLVVIPHLAAEHEQQRKPHAGQQRPATGDHHRTA